MPFNPSGNDVKERVRQATDIVDLVGSYLQLRRQGRNFVALCPWHDDTKPSLQINPERQSYHCWVCDLGGDVFSFVMELENINFREALEMLADRAGIALEPRKKSNVVAGSPNDKKALQRISLWAEKQYHECLLKDPAAEPARAYLAERKISAESIEKFHLGFSPLTSNWLLSKTGQGGANAASQKALLEGAGILATSQQGGGTYDRFRGRLLFSIRDTQANPIAIGGRLIPGVELNSPAKYVNSPETLLFRKHEQLYGLDLARERMRTSKRALVMEGYTDVIAAHQNGVTDAVAVLGTALGEKHIDVLKRYADEIVLILDGDEAGQKRTREVLSLFIAKQVNVSVVALPEGLDPCDFLMSEGEEKFEKLIQETALSALDFAFKVETAGIDIEKDLHNADLALGRLLEIIAQAPSGDSPLRFERVLSRLAFFFQLDEKSIRQRVQELRKQSAQRDQYRENRKREQNSQAGTNVASQQGGRQASFQRPNDLFTGSESSVAPAGDPPIDYVDLPSDGEYLTPPDEVTEASEPVAVTPAAPALPHHTAMLEILLVAPERLNQIAEEVPPSTLPIGPERHIYEAMIDLEGEGLELNFINVMAQLESSADKSLLVKLEELAEVKYKSGNAQELDLDDVLEQLFANLHRLKLESQRIKQRTALKDESKTGDEKSSLLEAIYLEEKKRQGIE